jgi:octanoyl-[GcvH]:protein N-octanoyltransferase
MGEDKMMNVKLPAKIVILNRSQETSPRHPLYAFALEELLCRGMEQGALPVLHLWRHPRAFIMGLRDSRLPHAQKAAYHLEEAGYQTAVRNSGGAAVPLDLGVLNLTLLLPKPVGDVDHRKDFEKMVALIQAALGNLTHEVNKGEIIGSFCPGEFDLSIGGYKFCGIAQRRLQQAIAVQAFVIVEGIGSHKAALAKEFYATAAKGAKTDQFPLVELDSMASLSECLQSSLTIDKFIEGVRELWEEPGGAELGIQLPSEAEIYDMQEKMRERYRIAKV